MVKILWVNQVLRLDRQLATEYHCTRVKDVTESDWNKLKWLLQYICKTHFLPLIIAITEDRAITFIDWSHAIHWDIWGHSGMFVIDGKGALINISKKLSLNTTGLTETKTVKTGERMPKCNWHCCFPLAQGGKAIENILMQNNKSVYCCTIIGPTLLGKELNPSMSNNSFIVDKIS